MSKLSKIKLSNVFSNPLPPIRRFFKQQPQIWFSFVIAFGALLFAYMMFDVWPAGEQSVLCLDLNAQYVYYHIYMRDAIFGGESLFYSWSRNLSGEFVGIIGYYLFSPFNFLVWIFPISHVTEGLLLMILTKIGFIAVTMSIYLTSRGISKHATVMFSVMYALCSYAIVQTMNPMWLDGVMALPLVVMGIEALMKRGRYKLLVFSLVYSFVTCFYIGYMIGIFAALYFVYYALTSRRLSKENSKLLLRRTGLFAASAVIAVLISAFILLPVYASLSLGKFDFSEPDFSIRNNFYIFDMTRKLFINSYDTVRMGGLPFLFTGTLSLVLLPAYFFSSRIRRAKRFGGIALITALVASMVITPIDMFWHGRQVPNWLPYRYAFLLCFLFAAFGADAFQNLQKIPRKTLGAGAVFFTMLLIYWERADTVIAELGHGGRDVFNWFTTALPALLAVMVFTSFLILARNKLKKYNTFSILLIAMVCLEMTYNAQFGLYSQNQDITYSSRASFNSIVVTREVTDRINREDPTLFRMEKTFIRAANDPMALRMNGVTHSSSMLNADAIRILNHLGFSARAHSSRYSGATPLINDLLGFKYILHAPGDSHWQVHTPDDITVEVNESAMPMAYLVNPRMLNYSFDEGHNVFRNQNQMLSYMLGESGNEYFVRMDVYERRTENLVRGDYDGAGYSGYSREEDEEPAYIEYDIYVDASGEFYMYFPTNYERRSTLYVNNQRKGQVFETDHHHIHPLGRFEEGERFTVRLSLYANQIFFRDEIFMRLDHELHQADVARLHELNANTEFEARSRKRLQITTNHPEEMVLFASIPNEPGWRATINGRRVDIEDIAGAYETMGLMGIRVPAGENTIVLRFFPNMLPLGICLTLLGIYGLIMLHMFMKKSRAKAVKNGLVDIDGMDDYDGFDPEYVDTESVGITEGDNNASDN